MWGGDKEMKRDYPIKQCSMPKAKNLANLHTTIGLESHLTEWTDPKVVYLLLRKYKSQQGYVNTY